MRQASSSSPVGVQGARRHGYVHRRSPRVALVIDNRREQVTIDEHLDPHLTGGRAEQWQREELEVELTRRLCRRRKFVGSPREPIRGLSELWS